MRSNPDVGVVAGDLSDVDRLASQLEGLTAAFYLVHSMEATGREVRRTGHSSGIELRRRRCPPSTSSVLSISAVWVRWVQDSASIFVCAVR